MFDFVKISFVRRILNRRLQCNPLNLYPLVDSDTAQGTVPWVVGIYES